ncbi:MAG TPA: Ni/Fe hydrogenase subunit alpha [Dehalococcoidales bacterium]|nr:Ni/Fe hydrogenase subunit alpha [Dehalococcoidales bacterium]
MRKISIDPVTRLEGHGKIDIFLKDSGEVANCYLQIPELRGFEKFTEGRLAEDMPQITQRICGVCPEAHHLASTKTLDALFHVEPTPTAKKLRELLNSAFYVTDHTTHFYILGGPDFVMGPDAPVAERNILGVIKKVGMELAGAVINTRKQNHHVIQMLGGRPVHPVFGQPGGVSKGLNKEERAEVEKIARDAVEFAKLSMKVFDDIVLKNKAYVDLILSDAYTHKTYYMGMVDANNKVNFYDGDIRVVDPHGKEFVKFKSADYLKHIAEHVEPWSYIKFPYLKDIGWKGFVDGKDSGVFRVAPLARLNAADGMATPLAQEYYEKYFSTLGGKPVHHTLATHWARLVELVYAAERFLELVTDPEITNPNIRTIPTAKPDEGVGIVEAPRGTLIHHYITDEKGIIRKANLIVATVNNSAAINMSVKKAAMALIKPGKEITEGLLNTIEMAWRPYDPCFGCATHNLPGESPFVVTVYDADNNIVKRTGI